jgi:apolipoprotein N-acyltransferase
MICGFLKGFPFFAWLCLVPIFMYVRGKEFRKVVLSTFAAFLLGNLMAFNWIGSFGAKMPGGPVIVLLFLIPSLSVFSLLKILAAEYLSRRYERLRLLIYPSIWIIVDWIQSIGFLAFPWPNMGYSQYPFTSFIQISSFAGILGINFIIVLTNYIVSDLLHYVLTGSRGWRDTLRSMQMIRLLVAVMMILSATIYGKLVLLKNARSDGGQMRVSMIQTCISPWENWRGNRFRYLDELKQHTEASLQEKPDMIVWSEYATLEKIAYDYRVGDLDDFEKDVLSVASSSGKALFTGEIGVLEDLSTGQLYPQNNSVLINGKGEVVDTYPKIYLVPFGEWFPYGKWLPFLQRLLYSFGASSFIPGEKPVVFTEKGRKFGSLICYEGIFYRLCRQYRLMGADFLVNITNDGWSDSYSGHIQHFAASIFRAVENGIWYVRAGNTGFTVLVDPYGRITRSMPILTKGHVTGDMDFNLNHDTFYTRNGDMALYLSIIFILALSALTVYNNTRRMVVSRRKRPGRGDN